MNKKLLLLAGILALGATTFAAHTPTTADGTISAEKAAQISAITDSSTIEGLVESRQTGMLGEFSGSYAGEVKTIMNQGPGRSDKLANGNYKNTVNKIEWTVAKGKMNMGKIGFSYDVDRDYNLDKKWNKTNEGWDTEFGFDYQAGTFDMMGKEWKFAPGVQFAYDKTEMITSKAADPKVRNEETKRLFKLNPKISTTHMGFALDISPIVAYDTISETTAFQLDISNYRKLGKNWSTYGDFYFDFAGTKKHDGDLDSKGKAINGYANGVFSGNIDKDEKFAFSIEQYVGYEREVAANTYFVTEFGMEAYSLLQSDNSKVDLYVKPEVQYRAKLGKASVTPYLAYKTWTATKGYADSVSKNELSVGVKFGTSF